MPTPPTPEAPHTFKDYSSISAALTVLYDRVFSPGKSVLSWRMFEPRRMVPPGGYHSPKLIAASLYSILGENSLKMRAHEFIAPHEITAQTIAYEITNVDVPIYYVSESLSRAVAATELPSGIRIEELNWPMAALVLGFPQRFMLEYLGLDVCYVFAARLQAGGHRSRLIPFAPRVPSVASLTLSIRGAICEACCSTPPTGKQETVSRNAQRSVPRRKHIRSECD